MARRCQVTGKAVLSGNHVSHANNKRRRRFLPNMQMVSFSSDVLGQQVTLRLSTNGIRTVEHKGGIDSYLRTTPKSKLSSEVLGLRKRLDKVLASKKA